MLTTLWKWSEGRVWTVTVIFITAVIIGLAHWNQSPYGMATVESKAWKQLTQLIYEYEGSLGSRLHQKDESRYIAYAHWPDRETWKNSGDKLPDTADLIRKTMKDCCTRIETLYELDCVEDLLKSKANLS